MLSEALGLKGLRVLGFGEVEGLIIGALIIRRGF